MELRIEEGYCYQIINRMLDVTTPTTADFLKKLSITRGSIEIKKDEAIDRGFEELANWSMPEHDRLFVIDNFILICIPKVGNCYV